MSARLDYNSEGEEATDGGASDAGNDHHDPENTAVFTFYLPFLAWLLGMVVLFMCRFLIVETTLKFSCYTPGCGHAHDDYSDYGYVQVFEERIMQINVGLLYTCNFVKQTNGYWFATKFPFADKDGAAKAGIACAVLSIALGGFAIFGLPLVDPNYFLVDFTALCLASGLLIALTILALDTEMCRGDDLLCEDVNLSSMDELSADYCVQECKLGVGAYVAIVSSLVWFMAAFVACIAHRLAKEDRVITTNMQTAAESSPKTGRNESHTEAVEENECNA